jgi:hypothetical protein
MRRGFIFIAASLILLCGMTVCAYAKSGRVLVPFYVIEKGINRLTAHPLLTNPNSKGEIRIDKIVIYDRSDGTEIYTIKPVELEKATIGPMEALHIFSREYKSQIPAIPGRPLYHAVIYWEGEVTYPLVVKTLITSSLFGRVISQSVADPYYIY